MNAGRHFPASRRQQPDRSANVAERGAVLGRTVLALAVLLPIAACARPVGDLGRVAPHAWHETVMPMIGDWRARGSGEPVSGLVKTDQESEMHARVWRYLTAPNTSDWFFDTATELQRTRIAPASEFKFKSDRYYLWLRSERFASSRVRYSRVSEDVTDDLATMPETFGAICAALEVDRQRAIAAGGIEGLNPKMKQDVMARKAENAMSISWFTRAVRYRYDAYSYALDHLLVETPHEDALRLDGLLSDLATYAGAAEAGDFCVDPLTGRSAGESAGNRPRLLQS